MNAIDSSRLLDDIIGRATALDAGRTPSRPVDTFEPAIEAGLEIAEIVGHHAALREAITCVVERDLSLTYRLRALRAVGRAIDDAIATVVEDHAEVVRASATKAAREMRFLADATAALASSLNYDVTLDQIARLTASTLADWCVVDLLETDGTLRRVSVAHRDPELTVRAKEWAREGSTDIEPWGAVANVIRAGKPELVCEISDELLSQDSKHVEVLKRLGICSYLIVPLSSGDPTLGAITLGSASPHRQFDDADITLATELARRAALAVENARAYAAARDAVRARDQLIAIVAHDLRNPLAAVGILATLVRKRHESEANTARDLQIIERSVDRMKHMISDLLDMSRIEAGKFSLDRKVISSVALVKEAITTHDVLAAERGIRLRADDDVADVSVLCDSARTAQVLANLVGNAIKFGRRDDTVTIGVVLDGDRARFNVTDTGPGIAPKDLSHIFELFWSATPGRNDGAGLGLYICKRIIDAHGGQIWAESTLGRGTTIYFTLPRSPSVTSPTNSSSAA